MKNVILLELLLLFINKKLVQGNMESEEATFPAAFESKYFIDKTMFIKDFIFDYGDSKVKLITAPTGFGKSTIIDMLKRFVSKSVNDNCETIPPETTENYKLFCNVPLEICQDKEFVKAHFGHYPVIHIDMNPLRGMISFGTMLERLRRIVQATFIQHKYLEQNETLWLDKLEKEAFIRYFHEDSYKELTKYEILYGFEVLSELLHRQFNTDVMVFIDNFDAYENSLLFKNVLHTDKIIKYYRKLHKLILKRNEFIGRALLVGVSRGEKVNMCPSNVQEYRFPGNHKFSTYLGFTVKEIEHIVKKNFDSELERNNVTKVMTDKCESVVINRFGVKMYSIWSVINYLKNSC